MQYKDYYKIMGLRRDASLKDVKRAYQKLAHRYHPDVSKVVGGEEKLKEVNEAYKVLKNPQKRAAFDLMEEKLEADWQEHHTAKVTPTPRVYEKTRAPPIVFIMFILFILYFFAGILQPLIGSFIAMLFMVCMIQEL